jgi:3-methyladenine DNA glycosylase Tag
MSEIAAATIEAFNTALENYNRALVAGREDDSWNCLLARHQVYRTLADLKAAIECVKRA